MVVPPNTCDEPDTKPDGTFDNPVNDICDEPDTKDGLSVIPLNDIWPEPDTKPDGTPVIPPNDICDEPDTNEGTFVKLLKLIEPVNELALTFPSTNTDPVNWCVSSDVSPNFVDPDEYMTDDETYVTKYWFALIVPFTSNEPVTCRLFVV